MQAVTQWLESRVPDDRLEKVATVTSIADLFDCRRRSDRIPGVVRREACGPDCRVSLSCSSLELKRGSNRFLATVPPSRNLGLLEPPGLSSTCSSRPVALR